MTTLLQVAQTALREMGRYAVPTSIIGNTDPTAVRCLALANRTGKTLGNDYRWQVLLTSYTFSTSNGVADYALPTGFGRFANLTQWNNTNFTNVRGPVSAIEWQALNSSAVVVGSPFNQFFRVAGNLFSIFPTPTSTQTIAYQYYSKYWISGKTDFTADTDVPLIDPDLVILGLRWQFLAALGDDFTVEEKLYQRRLESLQAADGGKDVIRFGEHPAGLFFDNIPITGFGT